MTILFVDSCDHYSATGEISRKWDAVTGSFTLVSNGGRFGGRCLQAGSLAGAIVQKSLPSAKTTVVVGMAVGFNSATPGNSTNTVILELRNGSTVICGLCYDFHSQTYKAFRTNTSTILGTVFKPHGGVAHHLAFKVLRNASTGTVDLWIDGVNVMALTNQNTGASDIDNVRIGLASTSSGIAMNFEDVFITDSESLGDRRVYMLVPNAEVTQNDFTPSTGTDNSALVDELPTNNDTDYVESSTVGHLDRYELTNLGLTPAGIDCVALNTINRKDDAGTKTVKGHIFSNATKADGATTGPATSYANVQDIFALDPDGNIAWTGSKVDSLRAGFEIVS